MNQNKLKLAKLIVSDVDGLLRNKEEQGTIIVHVYNQLNELELECDHKLSIKQELILEIVKTRPYMELASLVDVIGIIDKILEIK